MVVVLLRCGETMMLQATVSAHRVMKVVRRCHHSAKKGLVDVKGMVVKRVPAGLLVWNDSIRKGDLVTFRSLACHHRLNGAKGVVYHVEVKPSHLNQAPRYRILVPGETKPRVWVRARRDNIYAAVHRPGI